MLSPPRDTQLSFTPPPPVYHGGGGGIASYKNQIEIPIYSYNKMPY